MSNIPVAFGHTQVKVPDPIRTRQNKASVRMEKKNFRFFFFFFFFFLLKLLALFFFSFFFFLFFFFFFFFFSFYSFFLFFFFFFFFSFDNGALCTRIQSSLVSMVMQVNFIWARKKSECCCFSFSYFCKYSKKTQQSYHSLVFWTEEERGVLLNLLSIITIQPHAQ